MTHPSTPSTATGYLPERFSVRNAHDDDSDAGSNSGDSSTSSASTSLSSSASTLSYTSSDDSEYQAALEAEREWEENVRQLQLAVSVLILPTVGKWLGRKWSYHRECALLACGVQHPAAQGRMCAEPREPSACFMITLSSSCGDQSTPATSLLVGHGRFSCPLAGSRSRHRRPICCHSDKVTRPIHMRRDVRINASRPRVSFWSLRDRWGHRRPVGRPNTDS